MTEEELRRRGYTREWSGSVCSLYHPFGRAGESGDREREGDGKKIGCYLLTGKKYTLARTLCSSALPD